MKKKISMKKIIYFFLINIFLFLLIIVLYNLNKRNKDVGLDKVIIENNEEDIGVKYIEDSNMPISADLLVLESNVSKTLDLNGNEIEKELPSVIKVGTGKQAIFTGSITAYGGDCVGCSGVVSCRTESGESHNLKQKGHIYKDDEYGDVRIVAAPLSLFPCGSIIKIESNKIETFYAVVLDGGFTVENEWKKGNILLDLAFQTQNDPQITNFSDKNVIYKVQRWGW